MNLRFLATSLITLLLSLHAPSTLALTMKQVSDICHSSSGECSDHPIIRAYVGGALDLLATLDEQTDYLGKVYCKKVYEQAKARHPERWSGEIRNWEPVGEIHLNPEKKQSETKVKRAA